MLKRVKSLMKLLVVAFAAGVLSFMSYSKVYAFPAQNMLQESSVEISSDGTVADCWQHGSYGTNTASWSRTSDAHAGVTAERVDITSYTSGDRKLVSKQDTGTCAPAATPGSNYKMSAWVKGSGTVRFVTYYRNSGGSWVYWAGSSTSTLTSSWTQLEWTTSSLPSGATHISVGVALQSEGNMTLDDLSLAENVVENASLEASDDGITADCWQHGGYGTNEYSWSRVTTPHSGTYSERVDITSYTSGDRKLVSKQDTGTCAPSTSEGTSYNSRAWVKGSGPARLVAYYRSSGGSWTYLGQSDSVTLTSSWQEMSWQTPDMPSGATNVSIGVLLKDVGYLIVDDIWFANTQIFNDEFTNALGDNSLISNEYAYFNPTSGSAVHSPLWQLTSGSLFSSSSAGSTGTPDDCNGGSPNATSSNCTNSAIFRLNSKRYDFKDVRVAFDLTNNGLTSTTSTPEVDWDGTHIWLRYQNEINLYYASINRRDDSIVIKKKCPGGDSNGGTYYTLASDTGHEIPVGVQHVAASAQNNGDGSVTIKMYSDSNELLSATDSGTGCSAITSPGAIGIRGDNANMTIDNFRAYSLSTDN